MTHYEPREYFNMLMALGECDGSAGRAARIYALRFPKRRHPGANVIRSLERRCIETSILVPERSSDVGRPCELRNIKLEEEILEVVEDENWTCPDRRCDDVANTSRKSTTLSNRATPLRRQSRAQGIFETRC